MKAGPLQSLVATPAAGFEQPFEMLEACHDRVRRMLDLLARLRLHVRDHGADTQAQQAARDVMRYFDLAAPHHHRDEELHVFPPLLAQGDARVRSLVLRLQDEHVQMESRWQDARALLAGIAAGERHPPDAALDAVFDAFSGLYAGHLDAEEQIAYPAARALLDPPAIARASQEMRQRRGAS